MANEIVGRTGGALLAVVKWSVGWSATIGSPTSSTLADAFVITLTVQQEEFHGFRGTWVAIDASHLAPITATDEPEAARGRLGVTFSTGRLVAHHTYHLRMSLSESVGWIAASPLANDGPLEIVPVARQFRIADSVLVDPFEVVSGHREHNR